MKMLNIKKQELRAHLLEKRNQLTSEYRISADHKIFQNLISLPAYHNASVIFCFVSTKNEINTLPIIEHALRTGKSVAIPKCQKKGIMDAVQILSFDDLENGKYGILEPKSFCPIVAPEEIDFAIVPCLSCNLEGYRIGYGGGYYDRYLANLSCKTAVVCYREMVREEIPMEAFDVKIDIVITD